MKDAPTSLDVRLQTSVLFSLRPTVRVLFYTDSEGVFIDVSLEEDVQSTDFGVRILRDLLVAKADYRPIIAVDVINRHTKGHATRKLTSELLANYDQVWFFGILLANVEGALENELTDSEQQALSAWMTQGGVLMSGDHSNPRPAKVIDTSLNRLLGLGRAIGHRVPRAGALRTWEGNPGIDEDPITGTFSFNTQVPQGSTPINDLALQEDDRPQSLILKTYPVPNDNPVFSSGRRVHPLFCGKDRPIKIFPDHMHEGRLSIPQSLPLETWPAGPDGQPVPEVIARGTDKRNGEIYDILIAYDGSSAGVGRIVSDSTWHHYFNVNLRGFSPEGPVLPQLAEYYRNLAEWLAPPAKRAAIAQWRLWTLISNPAVKMAYGNSLRVLGRVASGVLGRSLGPCVIPEVISRLLAGSAGLGFSELPHELALGGVLAASFRSLENDDGSATYDITTIAAEGIRSAYAEHVGELEAALSRVRAGQHASAAGS